MVKLQNFIGIDISKETVDIALVNASCPEKAIFNIQLSNSKKGCTDLIRELKKHGLMSTDVLFCMEYTGIYSRSFAQWLLKYSANVWMEMPYQIKHSTGLKREKSDKADALTIAEYCARFNDKRRLYTDHEMIFEKLQTMLNFRDKLLSKKTALQKTYRELKATGLKEEAKSIEKALKPVIKGFEESLKILEKQIDDFVSDIPEIADQLRLLLSIPSVGKITALTFIAITRGFTKVSNSKALACYCGIAPFANTSGSSIRGKQKVSYMANRRLKTLLHLCAMRLIQLAGHFKNYYFRKVAEGKNKMLVINAIRNKLAQRMFSVIKHQKNYIPDLVLS